MNVFKHLYLSVSMSITLLVFIFSPLAHSDQHQPVRLIEESQVCWGEGCAAGRDAIVFIHGLTGNRDTWVNKDTGFDWPKSLSNEILTASFDVYQLEYDSNRIFSSPNVSTLNFHVAEHLKTLTNKKYESISIIAHSLGGNIARRYLQTIKSYIGHKALNQFRLVVLLGTPIEGSNLANITQFISNNEQLRTLEGIENNDYLQLINEQIHGTIQKHEASGCSSLRLFSAYETKPEGMLGIIVSKQSATQGAYACRSYEKSHTGISKPSSSDDPLYKDVLQLLNMCKEEDPSVCPKPFEDPENRCGEISEGVSFSPPVPEPCGSDWF